MNEHDLTPDEREALRDSQRHSPESIEPFPIGLRDPDKELTVVCETNDAEYIRRLFGRQMTCTHVEGRIRSDGKWECKLKLAPEPE